MPVTSPVRLHQIGIGERELWVLIKELHVRVSRRAVKVEVIFLDILTVVPLTVSEAEQAFFQDRIDPIPKPESETKDLFLVRNPSNSVFAPSVCPGPCMIVREVIPGVAVLAVVLPDRPPLPLREIRPPFSPGHTLL